MFLNVVTLVMMFSMPAVGGFYHGYDDDDVSVALVSKQRPCKRAAALSLAMEKDAGI